MFTLLLALAAQVTAVDTTPAIATSGPVWVGQARVATYTLHIPDGKDAGDHRLGLLSIQVRNAGSENDRLLSASTTAGAVENLQIQSFVNGEPTNGVDGDTTIRPGLTRISARLVNVTGPDVPPARMTVTLVFEKAGTLTVNAEPMGPPTPSPR
ncbi:hypothetical protein GCM10017620_23880 [Brevundimonas intermedia]|uniref:Copper chaperone PCu(A)C n=1 Tax=Brevundimonas intermedia TaxID=74315 RepID=A0ABQ5TBG2_9CAUL|nr:hypothetical protein [Brevundimonas intermedia]GLK49415.1 hypothetical protein GCM10017620_23880 [Brevundimonas intermedia]